MTPEPATDASAGTRIRYSSALRSAIAVLVLLLSVPLFLFPADCLWLHWAGAPPVRLVLAVAAFVTVAVVYVRRIPSWRWHAVAATCLFAAWGSCRVLTMGDAYWLRRAAADGVVTASSPGSGLLCHLAAMAFGMSALEWIAPVCGWLATVLWLSTTTRRLARVEGVSPADAARIAGLVWIGAGVCGVFFHGHVEHTQAGVPLMIVGIDRLRSSLLVPPQVGGSGGRVSLLLGMAALTSAALMHLQFAGFAVVAAGAVLAGRARLRVGLVMDILASAAAVVVCVALGRLLLHISGCTLVPGDVHGGPDGALLVPFRAADGSWFGDGALLSRSHTTLVASALLFAVPTAFVWALGLVVPAWRCANRSPDELVLAAGACAYLAYLATCGFDLGWPLDVDLMVTMSPALLVFLAEPLARAAATGAGRWRGAVRGLLALGVVSTWALVGPLVRSRGDDLSQDNTALATLRVDGAGSGKGPFRARFDPETPVLLEVGGPPGAPFGVFRGRPRPVAGGHPYGGVADIDLGPALTPDLLVFQGLLDADGRATFSWRVQPFEDGELPGIQALIGQRERWKMERMSAAFYFTR